MLIMKGTVFMKHLKIENDKGYFLKDGAWTEINRMTKDDLLNLVRKTIEDEHFEIDSYDETKFVNPAHKTIYSHISRHLVDLHARREEFIEEQQSIYKEAYDKYCL